MPLFDSIRKRLLQHPACRKMIEQIRAGHGASPSGITLAGLTRTAKALVAGFVVRELDRPLILVTATNESAEWLCETLACFLGEGRGTKTETAVTLPAFDCTPYEGRSPHPEISETRAVALWKLATGRAQVVVVPLPATLVRLQDASVYRSLALELDCGNQTSLEALETHLLRSGYERSDPVESVGKFSVRGGIADVFSPESKWPVRLEFFGNEIESIREFDPASQRSRQRVSNTALLPLSEFPQTAEFFKRLTTVLGKQLSATGARRSIDEAQLEQCGQPFAGWEFYAGTADAAPQSLFSLLPDAPVLWDEPTDREQQLKRFYGRLEESYDGVRDAVPPPPTPESFYWKPGDFLSATSHRPTLHLKELILEGDFPTPQLALHSQPPPKFHGQVKKLAEELHRWGKTPGEVYLTAHSSGQVDRLAEILREYEVPFLRQEEPEKPPEPSSEENRSGFVRLFQSELSEGVVLPELAIRLLSENDILGTFAAVGARKEKSQLAGFLSDLRDLKIQDYVVHVDHGIGVYQGLKQITHEGSRRDFMLITYQDDNKLYVPLERLDLIQKYRSSGSGKPALDRLGGGGWVRTKTRVKRALREMSQELLKLYAQRKMAAAPAFGPDSEWQREFEAAFEFEETPDQLTALRDVKRDLESGQPMDRLLCGDVGYGKTEVAMRAAFKVAQENKQVAVLTPTTVLAFQHYNTFRRRFAAFPVRIEMLSRFRSAAQQKKTVQDTESGKVDILIGTHRLLSKDVSFQNLGLLVVDEEQRFGVRHKEKLKELGEAVHVLSLSATPIPRTLNMSLGGLRDLSLIETPPKDRLAIQTTVASFNEALIQSAILSEMGRQGQVYFLHNRVESIDSIANLVQQLVPTARLAVAHGQMRERDLEKVMLRFIAHEFDVLVSTAIIENGLDIPRVNTILINRAERLGLADLYQLRGRVGRSNRRAYAYLMMPSEETLTPTARRRLAALKEFSDLGSGFRLAALDLELRGAGNLLGGEQHGHLNAVGIDLYLHMLDQTVRELKGQPVQPELRTQLNLGMDIRIPETYIAEEGQRLRMYKRISSLTQPDERDRLAGELHDRFGSLPDSVSNLLDYAALKSVAEPMLVESIDKKEDNISVRFYSEARIDPALLLRWVQGRKGASLRPSGLLRFPLAEKSGSVTGEIRRVLLELQA